MAGAPSSGAASVLTQLQLGEEKNGLRSVVFLVTFSRLLQETLAAAPDLRDPSEFTREQILQAVWDALENPAETGRGGRPRAAQGVPSPLVCKLLVVRETHTDGTPHYHVAVKLGRQLAFLAAKRTLRTRHGLVSHWSSAHT